MIRIGLVGACNSISRLRRAFELLLEKMDSDPVVYLGSDGTFDEAVREMSGARVVSDEMFLRAASAVALRGTAEEIEGLLAVETQAGNLRRLRTLPTAPALAVEMLGDRIVLLVHDKAVLEEEDIANASVIVHEAKRRGHKRIGPRHFLSPGALDSEGGVVGVLELDGSGQASLFFACLDGRVEHEAKLAFGSTSRMIVSRTA